MLKVVTGRFHPSLESALVEQIRRLKAADPWAKVAILAPSKPILDRLRRVLAIDHGLSLLNLHLFTFHQLALRLADELRSRPGHPPLRVVDGLFFEHLVRHLVEQRLAESPALAAIGTFVRNLGRALGDDPGSQGRRSRCRYSAAGTRRRMLWWRGSGVAPRAVFPSGGHRSGQCRPRRGHSRRSSRRARGLCNGVTVSRVHAPRLLLRLL